MASRTKRPQRSTAPKRPAPDDGDDPGPAGGVPFTVYFPDGELAPADLEQVAPLPRVGDTVEYIDEGGTAHRFVVRDVIHTLQAGSAARPHVRDGEFAPASFARPQGSGDGQNGPMLVRAGLPRVILAAVPAASGASAAPTPAGKRRRSRKG